MLQVIISSCWRKIETIIWGNADESVSHAGFVLRRSMIHCASVLP